MRGFGSRSRGNPRRDKRLYKLYIALSGDHLKEAEPALWKDHSDDAKLRNSIIHRGAHATEGQARASCAVAERLIAHLERVIIRISETR